MVMGFVLGLFVACLGLAFPLWLVWRAYSTSKKLERGLMTGDPELLGSDQFKIDRVTLGPQGTQLIDDVEFIVAPQPQTTTMGERNEEF
jgi:hypothetical protein